MAAGPGDSCFEVEYELFLEPGIDAEQVARNLCLEQTVELSDDLIVEEALRMRVVGRIVSLKSTGRNLHRLVVSYPWAVAGGETPQLFNVLFGNISMKSGIRLIGWSGQAECLPGPAHGIEGLRRLCGVPHRPLICTALKPMGSSSALLAEMAYALALGGLDIIKDDHGLANQDFAPFAERVPLIQAAVARANRETGSNCLYFPSFTAPMDRISQIRRCSEKFGIQGVLVCPMLMGMDSLRYLRHETNLVLMAHPALTGGFFSHPHQGIAPGFLLGTWFRQLGADASIYPNVGGRFLFDLETCHAINRGCKESLPGIRPAFPVPAGGMSLQQIPQMRRLYGDDLIILIGSGLFREDPDLTTAARLFRRAVEEPIQAVEASP